ncbi:hypothetical protein BH11PLA2_BH11PLA2_13450 [soil metagenome]
MSHGVNGYGRDSILGYAYKDGVIKNNVLTVAEMKALLEKQKSRQKELDAMRRRNHSDD